MDAAITSQYKAGGSQREQLEMALLESLSKNGLERASYKRVKARDIMLFLFTNLLAIIYTSTIPHNMSSFLSGGFPGESQDHQGKARLKRRRATWPLVY